jgi:hypothetical protein
LRWEGGALTHNVVHDPTVDISEAEVPTGIAEGQFFVVQAEQPEDGRVQVVHVHGMFDRLVSVIIRVAVSKAGFDTTPLPATW